MPATAPRSTMVMAELDDRPSAAGQQAKAQLNSQKADVTTQQLRDAITELDKQIPDAGAEDRRA